jgi:transcription elongation factor GreA
MEMEYTLVAGNEADLKLRKISVDSPIGKGLLGKAVGETTDIQTPAGLIKFEIISIER